MDEKDMPIEVLYDASSKTERNTAIRNVKRNHPELTLREIGELFDLSPSTISVTLKKKAGK